MKNLSLEVAKLTDAARDAFRPYSELTPEVRSTFLEAIATEIESLGDALLECASRETSLPMPRLVGERGRTCAQLRMFANLIREGSWVDARIETADPDRTPLPKPDLRRMLMPLGPVAVFGASNFPLAFSVAGGDTASALAAGCPVVYKPNPGHPETSAMVANAVLRIVKNRQLPHGTFGMTSQDLEAGRILALDPKIMAIGFTGSLRGGRALFDLAAGRPNPIPVYAEMGSVNPVVVMPHAVSNRREAIAKGYAQSLTMGVGQFCTNPGLLIGVDSPEFQQLVDQIAGQVSQAPPAPMLHPGIHESYVNGVKRMAETDQVTVVVAHQSDATLAGPGLFQTTADVARANPEVLEEVFGPAGLVISCNDLEDLTDLIASLPGQLTASVLLDDAEIEAARPVISAMAGIAGRVVLNGYPTGVEVHSAMQHGGPYPATTDSRSTSVGTAAILRFVRPICFQGFPTQLLPDALKDENPGKISRTVNGTLTNGQL